MRIHEQHKLGSRIAKDGHPRGGRCCLSLSRLDRLLVIDARREPCSERDASVHRWSMKLLTVMGLFLDLVGVIILGMGEVMKGAASLRSLKESYTDSFEYDIQQRPWYVRPLIRLGATLGAPTIEAQREPPPYRAFPLTVYGFFLLSMGFLLQLLAALYSTTRMPQ
jgi:hypothetical protein